MSVQQAAAPTQYPTARDQSMPVAQGSAVTRAVTATGLIGIAVIHLADLPGKMSEVPYLGWSYVMLIVASMGLAALIIDRYHPRQLLAAAGLALAVLAGFIINRTVGMPGATDDIGNWTEPLGMVSLLVEAAVAYFALTGWVRAQSRN